MIWILTPCWRLLTSNRRMKERKSEDLAHGMTGVVIEIGSGAVLATGSAAGTGSGVGARTAGGAAGRLSGAAGEAAIEETDVAAGDHVTALASGEWRLVLGLRLGGVPVAED